MQEEVEQKSLTLTVNAAKMTARLFRAAIAKYVAHKKEKKHDAQTGVRYVGRQSVKKLVGQNQGVSNVELSGEDIKAFERVARKYGVDYAVKKVKGDAPRFLIFFKARDADALNAALSEYTARKCTAKNTTGCGRNCARRLSGSSRIKSSGSRADEHQKDCAAHGAVCLHCAVRNENRSGVAAGGGNSVRREVSALGRRLHAGARVAAAELSSAGCAGRHGDSGGILCGSLCEG